MSEERQLEIFKKAVEEERERRKLTEQAWKERTGRSLVQKRKRFRRLEEF